MFLADTEWVKVSCSNGQSFIVKIFSNLHAVRILFRAVSGVILSFWSFCISTKGYISLSLRGLELSLLRVLYPLRWTYLKQRVPRMAIAIPNRKSTHQKGHVSMQTERITPFNRSQMKSEGSAKGRELGTAQIDQTEWRGSSPGSGEHTPLRWGPH